MVVGARKLHGVVPTRQAHTQRARPPGPHGHGRDLPARRRAHASGTHTEGLRNGPRAISHISDMYVLTYLFIWAGATRPPAAPLRVG